ncbi:methyl-CpG-binding domain protein 2-like [Uloborus diversus]|uniref:methyl-CpG-binding domain protein 2-like n=1 Tax=Uloborus diversus TaxID=327109 RepID=UPI0024090B9C|nr:methyl-CpG-binding domain protein 2-like [Uloborus diversus]
MSRKSAKGLPPGWKRQVKIRQNGKTAGKEDTYLFSPDNVKIRSKVELEAYLKERKSKLTIKDFNLPAKKIVSASAVKKSKGKNTVADKKTAKKSLKPQDRKSKIISKKTTTKFDKKQNDGQLDQVFEKTAKKSSEADESTDKSKDKEREKIIPKVAKKFPSKTVRPCIVNMENEKDLPDLKTNKRATNSLENPNTPPKVARRRAESPVKSVTPKISSKNKKNYCSNASHLSCIIFHNQFISVDVNVAKKIILFYLHICSFWCLFK